LASPGTGASAEPKQAAYKVYDHVIKATPPATGEHKFRLVVPDGLAVVRGILVVGPFSGGDSRDFYQQAWYREFLNFHGFAFLGATNYYLHDYAVMQAALKQFSADSKHPELVNAPFAATGFSAGGGYTRQLMRADPDKVIAGVVVGSTMKLRGELTDDHRRVPMCVINGELEHDPGEGPGMAKQLEPVLAEHRPKGALWAWMAVKDVGHEVAGQEVLAMPMLDAAVRLRYPADGDVRKGPLKLKTVELESGWIADNTSWTSGLTAIAPAKKFKGDVARSSWLLNEDVAFIYRAYSTLDWPLKITSPGPKTAKTDVLDAGSAVTIKVDDSQFAGWTKLDLYDGAAKVGELTQGKAEFKVKDLKAGYHAFSVLGTDNKGNTRPSNPVLVVVRKPAEKPTTVTELDH
jgi:predicted esterase